MVHFLIAEVRIGKKKPFGPDGALSAMDKQPVRGPVQATVGGLIGDEQADTRHHGGVDKAVHAYSAFHYAAWAASLPEAASRFRPGGFGENLVVDGATEADLCLGDRWRAGEVLLEVSQGRQPCWKLNVRFGVPDMARRVQASGWTGWYFRVVEPGQIAAGTKSLLEARPHPDWPLTRVTDLLYRNKLDREALTAFASLPCLPEGWRRLAERRLESGRVEDWGARLGASG
ncbi:MOSC domain-containing protein [Rhizobium sp. ARZ01]|uniref:MOSC domain-containing protein n=1 Tax=Rhizobium sp. ARZ01 TaxID=2769313 RepID=UPI0017853567|nr:MOSC domain-containing protein [Rhizobium sp. ARZ01]MBD9375312.1 MOSC domain-containing protein [Rhizobium sp. ARZ01]